ncbi:cell filamentation protein Fic [Chitinophaga sp. SYP-B3965]|uniref:Fic family protein n=1 Tax=Chitinophaga sp. SYP-B3965 TaxID=2663120 RepID=UPI0012998666|nr:Fic family protein [Chitinophaga sp. SYP-B3965]MRG47452.1 cell filamentation protein Fic [Chitinophaga sp. SYP-B3965]
MPTTPRQQLIIRILGSHPNIQISEIKQRLTQEVSIPTLNRDLKELVSQGLLTKSGEGRNTTYRITSAYQLLNEHIGDSYFDKDIDEREGNKRFEPDILSLLETNNIFSENELKYLGELHAMFLEKIATISPTLLQKETERLSIELSWKSSQIEGNTYSLLETELLLSQKLMAKDKDKSEATMLLNHKMAIDYLYDHRITLTPLKVRDIEDIHSLLIQNLGVSKNLRKRPVGITGTTYTPPDNEFQIREYLERACEVINNKDSVFEKALLAILLISLIQPFEDGNKRTGRITSNGILIENGYCALSYRGVQPLDYKKAMILFYEQNNVSAFKKLFIDQYAFAVRNYF